MEAGGNKGTDETAHRCDNLGGEFSLGHIVATRKDVDALLAKAKAAGAPVTEVHDRPWGIYSGYFRDPAGHLWEIIHNPNATEGNI